MTRLVRGSSARSSRIGLVAGPVARASSLALLDDERVAGADRPDGAVRDVVADRGAAAGGGRAARGDRRRAHRRSRRPRSRSARSVRRCCSCSSARSSSPRRCRCTGSASGSRERSRGSARGRLSFLLAIARRPSFFAVDVDVERRGDRDPAADRARDGAAGGDRYGAALVLAVAWGASIGGLGTPVGTPPNGFGIAELRAARARARLRRVDGDRRADGPGHDGRARSACSRSSFGIRRGQPLPPSARSPRPPAVVAWRARRADRVRDRDRRLAAPDDRRRSSRPTRRSTTWIDTHLTEEIVALIAGCSLFVLPGGARATAGPR